MAPLPVFHRPLDSIASSRRDINEGNSIASIICSPLHPLKVPLLKILVQ